MTLSKLDFFCLLEAGLPEVYIKRTAIILTWIKM